MTNICVGFCDLVHTLEMLTILVHPCDYKILSVYLPAGPASLMIEEILACVRVHSFAANSWEQTVEVPWPVPVTKCIHARW